MNICIIVRQIADTQDVKHFAAYCFPLLSALTLRLQIKLITAKQPTIIKQPNEAALLRKAVDGLKQEVEKVKNLVYAAKEVLNLEEAAMFLGISKSSLYKMTHNQVIPYFKPNNKMVYFEKAELLKWLRQNPVASQAQISEEAQAILRNLANKD